MIGRTTTQGETTEFQGTSRPSAGGIAAGPDGKLWFTDGAVQIGQITPAGEVTEFSGGSVQKASASGSR